MYSLRERLLIGCKLLLSFAKKEWTFEDYPSRVRRNDVPNPSLAWMAQFLNWPGPVGLGSTPEEARKSLRRSFEQISEHRRNAGETIPRPGASEAVRFAPATRVIANAALLDEFIEHVLGFPPGSPLFISDGSSLHDFGGDEEVERLQGLIRGRFGVESSDVPGANIAAILERIAASKAAA